MEQVFEKTDFGRMVVENRIEGMSHKARRLLILIDGKKTAAVLSTLSGLQHDFIDHLHHLLNNGLIQHATETEIYSIEDRQISVETTTTVDTSIIDSHHPQSTPIAAAIETPIAQAITPLPENFDAIKQWMADSGRQYLGIMGADVIRRIEAAKDVESLKRCVAPWITALRDSKNGSSLADMYLAQVNQQLP
ncbi:hypothetical protein LIN78_12595 [Leeia sp. TBRC 13508]|uniref:Uncharacterized protein n=1 Tax=Leeia speluncae TaxID=2884804 RepID=A0ABS8D847_9NEIS|nr:hypothetical protein [Leeia speluncae]MCB6184385.1 hypothetical protein [Leeia speluncae]